jgi:hypothetical protein
VRFADAMRRWWIRSLEFAAWNTKKGREGNKEGQEHA